MTNAAAAETCHEGREVAFAAIANLLEHTPEADLQRATKAHLFSAHRRPWHWARRVYARGYAEQDTNSAYCIMRQVISLATYLGISDSENSRKRFALTCDWFSRSSSIRNGGIS